MKILHLVQKIAFGMGFQISQNKAVHTISVPQSHSIILVGWDFWKSKPFAHARANSRINVLFSLSNK